MNILLIEDNQGDRDLMLDAFRVEFPNDKMTCFDDGEEALNFLKKNHRDYELVILDLNLPRKDGLEILRSMRMDHDVRSLPIVILTTSRWQADHDASRLLEADASFVKPSLFPQYLDLVRSIKSIADKKAQKS